MIEAESEIKLFETNDKEIEKIQKTISQQTEFIQDLNGWQFRWNKLIATEDADEERYTKYIQLANGNITLGNSESNVKLNLTNELINFTDTDGNELARFLKNAVYLGMNSQEAVIDLCNGTGTLSNVKPEEGYKRLAIKSDDSIELLTDHLVKMGFPSTKHSAPSFAMTSDSIPWGNYTLPINSIQLMAGDGTVNTTGITISNLSTEVFALVGNSSGKFETGGYLRVSGNDVEVSSLLSNKTITIENGDFVAPNNKGLRGIDTTGTSRSIAGISDANDINLGFGTYQIGDRYTHIYGGADIQFILKNPNVSWVPYYRKGLTVSCAFSTGGYITNSGKDVTFIIPLARPIIGNPTVSVASVNGITVRQDNKYLYGSSATAMVKPSSYSASLVNGGSGISVTAKMANTTNVTNNSACGIAMSVTVTFS